MPNQGRNYLIATNLETIPFIVHGFGTKTWSENSLERAQGLSRFAHLSLRQIHSAIVRVVRAIPDTSLEGDAMITTQPGILLVIKTADCLPVFIVDMKEKAIGAVHCGWKGTVKRICQKTVEAMASCFGSEPRSMLVGMGPCIATGCYEVGEDVFEEFKQSGLSHSVFHSHPQRKNKYFLDLVQANRLQLTELGVPEENIVSVALCTHCDDTLLSYRRDRKTRRRLVNFIGKNCRTI